MPSRAANLKLVVQRERLDNLALLDKLDAAHQDWIRQGVRLQRLMHNARETERRHLKIPASQSA